MFLMLLWTCIVVEDCRFDEAVDDRAELIGGGLVRYIGDCNHHYSTFTATPQNVT
jgi:hypothetical protein